MKPDQVTHTDSGSASVSQPVFSGGGTTGYPSKFSAVAGRAAESDARSFRPAAQQPARDRPTPLPTRPKGRLFVGTLLIVIVGVAGRGLWESFFRYQAYGTVVGRVIHVPPPWLGIVHSVHVREGESVRQGQLLLTLENLELQQRLARMGDELRLAQASLEAEIAQLQWELQARGDRYQKALAEYYELWGALLHEEARLAELEVKLQSALRFHERGIVGREELEAIEFSEAGQRAKVEKLALAVAEMKKRIEPNNDRGDDRARQLKPKLVRIEALQAQFSQLREQLEQASIRAPVSGVVVKSHRFVGELASPPETLMEILEDGSLEPVVYLPQRQAESLRVGEEISVLVAPHAQPLDCVVVRLGDRLQPAPEQIQRYYRSQQYLLPVYLRPKSSLRHDVTLRLGSEIKLPYRW